MCCGPLLKIVVEGVVPVGQLSRCTLHGQVAQETVAGAQAPPVAEPDIVASKEEGGGWGGYFRDMYATSRTPTDPRSVGWLSTRLVVFILGSKRRELLGERN